MTDQELRCVVSVSGIRGVVGSTLDVSQVLALAAAFGVSVAGRGPVVVGRDSRPTGALFLQAASAGLRGVGCDVIEIGLVPTPTVAVMIGHASAAGGIQVSASHNPVEWNALKLFDGRGRNIDQTQLDRVLAAFSAPSADRWRGWSQVGGYRNDDQAIEIHLGRVLAAVDVEVVRKRRFRVVLDSVNGAGSRIGPELLARLGCQVVPLYTAPDQPFPRDPEPTAANVRETGAVVKAVGADLGFVQDPDADRLAIIDERGEYIGEEYTLVLCAAARLAAAGRGAVACANLSTSRMLDDVALRSGARVVRSQVGEAHVLDAMQANGAVIGGEGNGGVIDPRVVAGRDSQIGMALVLEHLARAGTPLSQVIAGIPRYAIHKEKLALDRSGVAAAIARLAGHQVAAGAEADTRDGLKLIWPDRWVHLRASGTELASRLIVEAPTEADAKSLAASVRQAIAAAPAAGH